MDDNQKTLAVYEDHIQEYIDGTPQQVSGDFQIWIDHALNFVPNGGSILELGSAFGRDADYLESKGYRVERSDATKGFVELVKKQGHEAIILNALTDNFGKMHDMVFANAVLLHFGRNQTASVVAKVYQNLSSGGVFAFTVKKGDGEGWSDHKMGSPRYFCFWQEPELRNLLLKAGFEAIEITTGSSRNAKWLHIIAQKQSL